MSTNSKAQPNQPSAEVNPSQTPVSEATLRWWTGRTRGPTFASDKVRWWTEKQLEGAESILNPCAGPTRLSVDGDVLRVEVDEENGDADIYADFRNLLQDGHVEPESYDAIVYDPPYSLHQCNHKYQLSLDRYYFHDRFVKELFDQLLKPGGTFIQFGYTSETMPIEFGYEFQSLSIFNKTGCQNDYLGVAVTKPTGEPQPVAPFSLHEEVLPNQGAEHIKNENVTVDGNAGLSITAGYHYLSGSEDLDNKISTIADSWTTPGDRVLHIYETEPRVQQSTESWTTCAYYSPDLSVEKDELEADIVETPWNIGSRFATGVFDVVILDLPHEAWQQNIRKPTGSGRSHVDTIIKRSITDLVRGGDCNGGLVVQIGKTATLMSNQDYDYVRQGIDVVRHPHESQDWIVAVDKKHHKNLEIAGLGEGEVDGEYCNPHGAPKITSKHNRTHHCPSPNSHFCIHCGNSYFHHPAAYVTCTECGAAPNNMCRTNAGDFQYPSGPDYSITAADLCAARIESATEYHNGNCNSKERVQLSEPADQQPNAPEEGSLTESKLTDFSR